MIDDNTLMAKKSLATLDWKKQPLKDNPQKDPMETVSFWLYSHTN